MYVVTVEFVIKAAHIAAFHEEIVQQAKDSLEEPGCHHFDVAVDPENPAKIFLYELYTDAEAFEVHKAMPHTKSLFERVTPWIESRALHCYQLIHATAR